MRKRTRIFVEKKMERKKERKKDLDAFDNKPVKQSLSSKVCAVFFDGSSPSSQSVCVASSSKQDI